MSEDLRLNDRNPAEVVLNVPRTCRRSKKFAHNRIARSFNYHTVATCPTPSISNLEIPDRSHFISETKKAAARFRMIFFFLFFLQHDVRAHLRYAKKKSSKRILHLDWQRNGNEIVLNYKITTKIKPARKQNKRCRETPRLEPTKRKKSTINVCTIPRSERAAAGMKKRRRCEGNNKAKKL